MFDLEQAISEWRREMLAAGVKAPVPLQELESHLREEIGQQAKSGLGQTEAFAAAVQTIGPADKLQTEFQKQAIQSFNSKKSLRAVKVGALNFIGLALLGVSQMHSRDAFLRICGVLVLLSSLIGLGASCLIMTRASNFWKDRIRR